MRSKLDWVNSYCKFQKSSHLFVGKKQVCLHDGLSLRRKVDLISKLAVL